MSELKCDHTLIQLIAVKATLEFTRLSAGVNARCSSLPSLLPSSKDTRSTKEQCDRSEVVDDGAEAVATVQGVDRVVHLRGHTGHGQDS